MRRAPETDLEGTRGRPRASEPSEPEDPEAGHRRPGTRPDMSGSPHRSLAGSLLLALALGPPLAAQQPVQSLARHVVPGGPAGPPCASDGGSALLPPGFQDELLFSSPSQVLLVTHDALGRLLVAQKDGVVRVVEDGAPLATPLIDLSEEVGDWGNAGLLGFTTDPGFASNGYVYLYYVVDKHHLLYFGTPSYDPQANQYGESTIARVSRYTATAASGFTVVDPASRLVLIGEDATSGIPYCGDHAGGGLACFEDGTLAVSCGDGGLDDLGSPTCVDEGILGPLETIGLHRTQLVDSLSGKLLRIDPTTGDGVPSNPFYVPAFPRAVRSRVWALGLRNPFRIARRPGSGSLDPADGMPGTLLVGDVGGGLWEELDVARGGENFGWPLYEGLVPNVAAQNDLQPNLAAPNPLYGVDVPGYGPCTQPFFNVQDLLVEDSLLPPSWPHPCYPPGQIGAGVPRFTHARPELSWAHFVGPAEVPAFDAGGAAIALQIDDAASPVAGSSFAGNCSVGGAWYDGFAFPAEYYDTYLHADFGSGWIRRLVFDAQDRLVAVHPFAQAAGAVVSLSVDPVDGSLVYVDFGALGVAEVRRISYSSNASPPTAVATANPAWGPAPLRVQLDGGASIDPGPSTPAGGALSFDWELDDGSPPSFQESVIRWLPAVDITDRGAFTSRVDTLDPPGPTGFGNPDPEVMRDGVYPAPGTYDPSLQYDTWHLDPATLTPDKGPVDYVGYEFAGAHTLTGLVYQEGIRWTGLLGGWWTSLDVEVRSPSTGQWSSVTGLLVNQAYTPVTDPDGLLNFQVFELIFDPVVADGVRLHGDPGGYLDFVSVGELRVLALPKHGLQQARNVTARLRVTDALGAQDCTSVTVTLNDSPPTAVILGPKNGGSVSNLVPTTIPLRGKGQDAEDDDADLACEWQVVLHHDNHTHPEPPVPTCKTLATLLPHDMDPGDVIFHELIYTVTDSSGLTDTRSSYLFLAEDSNFNGVLDAVDIASGTSLDLNGNGVPDESEADCDGDGVHDLFELVLGTQVDADGDGVPDDCP